MHFRSSNRKIEPSANEVMAILARRASADGFAGWDPFDGLASRVFQATPLRGSPLVRLAWLQLMKRSAINFRGFVQVPKLVNPKAVSLCLRAFLLMGQEDQARFAFQQLLKLRCPNKNSSCLAWGYPFDWQARAFFVPAGAPNLVCTAYVVRAVAAAANLSLISLDQYADLILGAARFIESHLAKERHDGTLFIGYVPKSDALVYNVVSWGAYVFAEAASVSGEEKWRQMASASARLVCQGQSENGGWAYGTSRHHRFADGFHTGYILEALALIERLLGCSFENTIRSGIADYQAHYFDGAGRPTYYRDRAYPIDCHSAAQAVLTLLLIRPTAQQEQRASEIISYIINTMWDKRRGCFYYQKTWWGLNRIDYFRWTQAWMLLAIAAMQNVNLARRLS